MPSVELGTFFLLHSQVAMENIVYFETVDSTNRIAREQAVIGKPHGFAVLAGTQSAGRGRLERVWHSPSGQGLYCTILLRPSLPVEDYSKITLTAGLAVCQIIEELCPLKVQLKWPNDIYISGRKCGGILTEASSLQGDVAQHFALVGIGLNINGDENAFKPDLQKTATSLLIESGKEYEIFEIFAAIRGRLLQLISQLREEGFTEILTQWRERDMLQGRWMKWVTTTGEIIYGQSLGVDHNGMLLVHDNSTGRQYEVLSGDVSLAARFDEKGMKAGIY